MMAIVLPLMVMAQSVRKEVQLAEGWRFSLSNEAMKQAGDAVAAENTAAASAPAGNTANPSSYAHTVLEAHETLMDVDEGNVKKFDKVVSLVKQDLERKK